MPEEEVQTEATGEGQTGEAVAATEDAPAFDWKSNLPDDIRDHTSLQTIKGANADEVYAALAKQHISSQQMIGMDKIAVPGKNASDEQKREYMTQLGCPETIDGYKAPTEGISEGFDNNLFDAFRPEAHRLGVTSTQFAGMARMLDGMQSEARDQASEAHVTQLEEWEAQTRKEHGDAFAQNFAIVEDVLRQFGGDDIKAWVADRGLGLDPVFFNMLTLFGQAIGQDDIVGLGGNHTFENTPDQATTAWNELKLDTDFMAVYLNDKDVGYKAAVEKAKALFAQGAKA
jgi:hypothetical protein